MFKRSSLIRFTCSFAFALAACSGSEGDDDTGAADTGSTDRGQADAGTDAGADAGPADTGRQDTGTDAGTDAGGDAGDTGGMQDDFRIPGLLDAVEIHFDDLGVMHILCINNADCFAAQGYFHAKHRFAQMDVRRRFARGTLAALFGAAALDVDKINRRDIATRDGSRLEEQVWAASTTETQAAITDYTRGVNAWLADLRAGNNGAILSDEYLGYESQLEDWDVLDSVGSAMAVVEGLSNHIGNEINAGAAFGALSSSVAFDLYGLRPGSPSTILPRSGVGPNITLPDARDLESISSRMRALNSILGELSTPGQIDLDRGSNNWVVAPALSATGNALLANDPHLGLENPALWYMNSLDSKTIGQGNLHIAGISFAGMPGIVLGQNEDVAWGATVAFFDHSDAYAETLSADGRGVVFNGQDVPFVTRQFTFDIAGGASVTESADYVPHHGPVVGRDDTAGVALTIRWTGQDGTTDLNFLTGLWTATTVAEAQTAFRQITAFGQNLVVADNAGSIAWLPYNHIPQRPWASVAVPAWLPVPGDGSAEWGPMVDYAQLPQSVDPVRGYVATANNDMTGSLQDGNPANDGQLAHQTYLAPGFRHERIEQLLNASNAHTLQSMQQAQADTHSLLGERLVPLFIEAVAGRTLTTEQATVLAAIDNWGYTCPTGLMTTDPMSAADPDAFVTSESAGCTAFHVLWHRVLDAVFLDEVLAAGVRGRPLERALILIMSAPNEVLLGESYFDNVDTAGVETKSDAVAQALEGASMFLTTQFSADPTTWRWGRIHTLTLTAPVFDAVGLSRFNHGPFANDGGLLTVDVANPRAMYSDNYTHGAGASVRLACELEATARCTFELPGGQVHFRDDPNYDSAFDNWLRNVPAPLHFTATDVRGNSASEVTVLAP